MAGKPPYPLRLDPKLMDTVRREAAADLRSVNAEIDVLLREALKKRGRKIGAGAPPQDEDEK